MLECYFIYFQLQLLLAEGKLAGNLEETVLLLLAVLLEIYVDVHLLQQTGQRANAARNRVVLLQQVLQESAVGRGGHEVGGEARQSNQVLLDFLFALDFAVFLHL